MITRAWLTVLIPLVLLSAGPAWAAKAGKSAKAPEAAPVPAAPQEVVLRHGLQGAPLSVLSALVLQFNDQDAKLKSGAGKIVLEDVQGVADKQHLPHLAIFDEDDAQEMFGTRPRFRPLYKVMESGSLRFDEKQFYPQMVDAVDDLTGRMQALPLAMSLPVLYYNKAAFQKAKLDPDLPPKTWWELQEAAGTIRDSGSKCPLTASRFAWIHLENVSSQHGEPIVRGEGKSEQLGLNNLVNVKHVALLSSWYKSKYFVYSGHGREGDERFASGECAMLTGESSLYARLLREKPDFPMGVAVLPHYDDVHGARPANVLPDGAALWVLAADKKPELQVITRFITHLLKPEAQREWVRATGFLPMTPSAVQALREAGGNPAVLGLAEKRLTMPKRDTVRTKNGGQRSRIRAILNEEIEFVWGNQKPAKEALDHAVMRAAPMFSAGEGAKSVKR